jgi:hypothetical protein
VLCHLHPLYGGSMLTPVILTVEAAFHAAGFTTLAFNLGTLRIKKCGLAEMSIVQSIVTDLSTSTG